MKTEQGTPMKMARTMTGIALLAAVALVATSCGDDATMQSDTPETTAAETDGMDETEGMEGDMDDMDDMESGGGMQGMMQVLGRTVNEGLRIEAATSEPTTFTIFQGDESREVTPQPDDSVHLMAVLADDETGERIPYSEVWATVTDAQGDIVLDERLWPMISQGMGTHYGINVPLPEAGSYDVSLQVGPPQAARHPEYTDRWLEPLTFDTTLEWEG